MVQEFFDDGFPPGEQIPRLLEVTLRAEPGPFGETVRMTVNGLRVGNPLTDNGWGETGYRWHDALHLAHATCLGWSPVLRGLAGLKRRSDPRVDHVEDGGRAGVADEAIAWAVFCHARARGWYEQGSPDSSPPVSVKHFDIPSRQPGPATVGSQSACRSRTLSPASAHGISQHVATLRLTAMSVQAGSA